MIKRIFNKFYSIYLLLFAILICVSIFVPSFNKIVDLVINVLLSFFLMFTIFDLVYLRRKYKKQEKNKSDLSNKLHSERKHREFEKDVRDNLN